MATKYLMKRTTVTPKPKAGAIGRPSSPSEEEISKAFKERAEAHVKDLYGKAKRTKE